MDESLKSDGGVSGQSDPQAPTVCCVCTEDSAAGREVFEGPGRGGGSDIAQWALSPTFAQAGGGVMDSESVNHGEGKVLGHGAGRGQRLPEGCLVSASCGVPDSVYLRFQAGQIHDPVLWNLGWREGGVRGALCGRVRTASRRRGERGADVPGRGTQWSTGLETSLGPRVEAETRRQRSPTLGLRDRGGARSDSGYRRPLRAGREQRTRTGGTSRSSNDAGRPAVIALPFPPCSPAVRGPGTQ